MQDKRDKILFVEDNRVDLMAFERFARREAFPYDYITAGSTKEARKIIQSEKFDAAVIDYLLRDGTAFDLFDNIKDTPIIIEGTKYGRAMVNSARLFRLTAQMMMLICFTDF